MNTLLIGNAIALSGSLMMVLIGFIQDKKKILVCMCVQFVLMGLGNLVLGGMTGFFANLVGIARNLFMFKFEFTTIWKIIFILIQSVMSLVYNTQGLLGWIPVISTALFTWLMDTKSDATFKLINIICLVLWVIYDLSIWNISATVFDVFAICSNATALYMILKNNKN